MKLPSEINVLIVEDNLDLLDVYASVFESFNYRVHKAINGKLAWDLLQTQSVDLVLTDVRMPVMDGVELLKRIRTRDRLSPCVLVTSGHTDYTVETLFELGANGFLAKPFGAAAIRDATQKALLGPELRWGQPSKGATNLVIRQRYKSLNLAASSGTLSFGNGGFFLSHPIANFSDGMNIGFQFEFDDVQPVAKIEGTGVIRWIRNRATQGHPIGLGVEILYLEPICRPLVCTWISKKSTTAFIPIT